jgi:hypothetical protein
MAYALNVFDPPWQLDLARLCRPTVQRVGGMVLLVLAAKASLTLFFYCEMDDKLGLVD